MTRTYIFIYLIGTYFLGNGQIVRDYIINGSFEQRYNCTTPAGISKAKGWTSIDSISFGGAFIDTCNNKVPKNTFTWQLAKDGSAYIVCAFYWKNTGRWYMRNRLSSTLLAHHVYCVRFFVNIANTSPRGMDGFGAYFADSSLDTITKCTIPLSYLNPQVKNPLGNVISDTLNWIPITGTFVATGNEKYMVIGNFLADNAVTTSTINGPFVNEEWTDVCIDDASCFDIDLPAYAGPDQRCIVGDSVFIGSKDPGLDEFCTWYQLPNTTVPIAIGSGLYVKPIQTTIYVVHQQLWCSGVKYDTVVVYKDAVGLKMINQPLDETKGKEIKIIPNPASKHLLVSLSDGSLGQYFKSAEILDAQTRVIKEIKILDSEAVIFIRTDDVPDGIYVLRLWDGQKEYLVLKKFAVQN